MSCHKPSKASSANLVRSFRNVPKAAESRTDCTGICHLCLSGRPHYDYEDVLLIASYRETFLPHKTDFHWFMFIFVKVAHCLIYVPDNPW